MNTLAAARVTSGKLRGSSRPVVVDTESGARLVKLRGAAQGTGPLVAEVIVAALAEAVGLSVPARSLVQIPEDIAVEERDAELRDLVAASAGINLGFAYLAGAHEATAADLAAVTADDRATILWLDGLVLNPDRTRRNPNMLHRERRFWLIDHGAALGFQYDWASVSEATPRRPSPAMEPHLFADSISPLDLALWDEVLSARLSRETIENAVAEVPDTFLAPLVAPSGTVTAIARRRAAYVAFLWKRLKAPRPFLDPRIPRPSAVA